MTLAAGDLRGGMTEAFARFHMAERVLKAHTARWRVRSAELLAPLNAYYDALELARKVDPFYDHRTKEDEMGLVPEPIRRAGLEAERECSEAHERRLRLAMARDAALREALTRMGAHHGAAMAEDACGDLLRRYWRHARRMAATLRSHLPGSRVVGVEPDFASAEGWARAMGLRGGKALVDVLHGAMAGAGMLRRDTCRLAGVT